MVKGKEQYQRELVTAYLKWKNTELKHWSRHMQCLSRDHQRKIKKVFQENFHQNIDEFITENNFSINSEGKLICTP